MLLQLENINKTHSQPNGDRLKVLSQIGLSLDCGQSMALLGESGSGKSTLLHLIAGLDKPDNGRITFNEQNYDALTHRQINELRRNQLSLIFQQYHLISTLNVADNIRIQAKLSGNVDAHYYEHLVQRLHLHEHLNHYPYQLSGGQQQRVAIARALLHKPQLILADEPTGNLDEATSQRVMETFLELIGENNTALLMVTHSPSMAQYCDSQWYLKHGSLVEA